jgi:hypothetical protein
MHHTCACRAALVLASSAERLTDLLKSLGKGVEEYGLPGSVMVSATVEARYAVRFMMESLFPGLSV